MTKEQQVDHMIALMEEITILTQRLQPHDTGYLHTTINTLKDRVNEIKREVKEKK